jgi:hypothetical protein
MLGMTETPNQLLARFHTAFYGAIIAYCDWKIAGGDYPRRIYEYLSDEANAVYQEVRRAGINPWRHYNSNYKQMLWRGDALLHMSYTWQKLRDSCRAHQLDPPTVDDIGRRR